MRFIGGIIISKDKISKRYLCAPERIADILNYYIYQGKLVIKPGDIRERKQEYSMVKRSGKGIELKEVRRDVAVEIDFNMTIAMIAIENQNDIHYAMPIRMVKGEAFWYDEQWEQIGRQHRAKNDLKGAEYISRFARDDKVVPMLGLCIYLGEKPWDGPRNLKDIMGLKGIPPQICQYFMDYPINLIEVNKLENLEFFRTDLRLVFGFLQKRKNKNEIIKFVKENEKEFQNLQEDAFDFICIMAYCKELLELKKTSEREGGIFDMCQAIKELIKDGERRGERRGRRHGHRQGMEQGIYLARKVILMNTEGRSYDDISKQCGISVEKVKHILTVPVV